MGREKEINFFFFTSPSSLLYADMSNTPIIITSHCLYFKEKVQEEKERKIQRKSKKREVKTVLNKHDNLENAVIMVHRQELRSSSFLVSATCKPRSNVFLLQALVAY